MLRLRAACGFLAADPSLKFAGFRNRDSSSAFKVSAAEEILPAPYRAAVSIIFYNNLSLYLRPSAST
jgi:hypothetical protein